MLRRIKARPCSQWLALTTIFTLLLLIAGGHLHAQSNETTRQPVIERSDLNSSKGFKNAFYFIDPSNSITAEEILDNKSYYLSKSKPIGSKNNLGLEKAPVWILFLVSPEARQESQLVLEYNYPAADSATLFYQQNGKIVASKSGDNLSPVLKDYDIRTHAFPIPTMVGDQQLFLLRIKTRGVLPLTCTLWSSESFAQKLTINSYAFGWLFGILFTVFLYNLCLWLIVRDEAYAYYLLHQSCFILFALSMTGFGRLLLWPHSIAWANNSIPFFASLSCSTALIFGRHFLNTSTHTTGLDRVLIGSIATGILGALVSVLGYYKLGVMLSSLCGATGLLLVFASWQCYRAGEKNALIYLCGWLSLLLGVLVLSLRNFGFLPDNIFTTTAVYIGAVLEVFILSFGLVKKFRDLRFEKEIALSKSNAKGEFLAVMSHEIRTPLNGLLNSILLMGTTPTSDEQGEYLVAARECGNSLSALLNDILDYEKIGNNSLELINDDFDVRQLAKDLFIPYELVGKKKGLEMVFHCSPSVPQFIRGDSNRIRQILLNILSNALKFTAEGAIVFILDLEKRDDDTVSLLFSVSDTGIGIEKKDQFHIFESFRQAEVGNTRKYGGTGLGLSISRSLANLMKGDITVRSKPGIGTVFHTILEVGIGEEAKSSDSANDFENALTFDADQIEGMNILVVDDNAVNRKLTERILEKLGHSVSLAQNGVEAVRTTNSNSFDLILMDLHMPVMDGLQAIERIRERELASNSTENVPIYMLSADVRAEAIDDCCSNGANGFLAKPLKKKELIEVLKRCSSPAKMTKSPDTSSL